ncbi:MAG: glycosyltransferase family 2 protein [Gammaproteobacteria bacterium]
MPTAVVVIPTKNEEQTISDVISDVRGAFDTLHYDRVEIVVTDDSTDRTRGIAKELGARVVNGGGEGLGTAMYRGLKASLKLNPDVIVSIDGDGQTNARAEIASFLAPIEQGDADLVLGSRFQKQALVEYRYRPVNRFGTAVLTWILRRMTSLKLTDSHGGIRAMAPEVVRELQILGTHTYVQETIVDASEKGFRIVELPSVWKKREFGKSRVVGSIPRYIAYTLPVLLLRSGQHIRALYTCGGALVLGAFLVFVTVLVQEGLTLALGHRTPAFILIALMIMAGLQMVFFGFSFQLLKQMKRSLDRIEHNEHP